MRGLHAAYCGGRLMAIVLSDGALWDPVWLLPRLLCCGSPRVRRRISSMFHVPSVEESGGEQISVSGKIVSYRCRRVGVSRGISTCQDCQVTRAVLTKSSTPNIQTEARKLSRTTLRCLTRNRLLKSCVTVTGSSVVVRKLLRADGIAASDHDTGGMSERGSRAAGTDGRGRAA